MEEVDVHSLNGAWTQTKTCYKGEWVIQVADDGESMTITEQPGSFCCGCVPNVFRKTHRMNRTSGIYRGINYTYQGKLGGKKVFIEIVSKNEIKHMTTDGLMVMRR
mmetsp:Transcript_81/g.142  ORF Transcript_81/g.142 Transcript_81/m.142 type:complete len:106 (-) Transcript_81:230-547(-)